LCNGKNRYQKRVIKLENIQDSRYLELILTLAERAWAHAELLIKNNSTNDSRQTYHSIVRYKKAEKFARDLLEGCHNFADELTYVEAEAYYGWISGNMYMKMGKLQEALTCFLKTYVYLMNFQSRGSLAQREFLGRLIEDVEPRLR
jgi:signal recognition particle subunit SRP68